MTVRTKENVQELLRRRFEAMKRSVGETDTGMPITIFVGTWTDEQVYEFKLGSTLDQYMMMVNVVAEAKRMRAQYVMYLCEAWIMKIDKSKLKEEGKDTAQWAAEIRAEKALSGGSLVNLPGHGEGVRASLQFADGSLMHLFAEVEWNGNKKVALETVETPRGEALFPSWNDG